MLEIIANEQAAVITTNFAEFKTALDLKMDEYRGLVFTDQQIPEARKTVAELRKLKAAIDTKRKELKKEHMIPYDEFEKQAKEIMSIIDSAIVPINEQIKEAEEIKRDIKRKEISNYFLYVADGNPNYDLSECWNDKWISNASYSIKKIKEEIDSYIAETDAKIAGTQEGINTIKGFNSEFEDKAIELFLNGGSLADAINLIREFEEAKKEAVEKARREEAARIEAENRAAELDGVLDGLEIKNATAQHDELVITEDLAAAMEQLTIDDLPFILSEEATLDDVRFMHCPFDSDMVDTVAQMIQDNGEYLSYGSFDKCREVAEGIINYVLGGIK